MTIEQAIEHAEDIAISAIGCECREEHRQLAEWLRELVERREAPEIIHCGECANFKDNGSTVGYCKRKMMYQYTDYFCGDAEKKHVENG